MEVGERELTSGHSQGESMEKLVFEGGGVLEGLRSGIQTRGLNCTVEFSRHLLSTCVLGFGGTHGNKRYPCLHVVYQIVEKMDW